jgi:hypothetical protein
MTTVDKTERRNKNQQKEFKKPKKTGATHQ